VSHSINLMPRPQRGFSLGHYLAPTRHATGGLVDTGQQALL
jgi:hypothetical protein